MTRFFRDNGLSLVLLALFAASLLGQYFTGFAATNEEREMHGEALLTASQYLGGGEFLSAVFENWESEFLQMSFYVLLTAYLFQRGSPESKDPDSDTPQDQDPSAHKSDPDAPWPVKAGGPVLWLYAHSLGLAMALLFAASFVLHWVNSTRRAGDEASSHGREPPSLLEHLGSPDLWFESFQNWQSEFLSTALLVLLGIWLRQHRSPESKPVAAPNRQTGGG